MRLARREALWAIKALRDEPLPLFEAASVREARTVPEFCEPAVMLRPMTAGSEVVEDMWGHPGSFLRGELRRQRVVTCADAMQARDGRWLLTASLVLARQMPGSAKGVLFITIEDETGIANLVIWPKLYERQRRIILSARMMAYHGHLFFPSDRDESMRIDAPGGNEVDLHRRCWIGRGGTTPAGCVRVNASALGYDSKLTALLASFTARGNRCTFPPALRDLFRERQGVVAEGMLGRDKIFRADSILAKHDGRYMPREVADALKKQGVGREGEEAASIGKSGCATEDQG
jgi:CcmE